MGVNRRTLLRVAGSAVTVGFAGCSNPLTSQPKLDLTIENYRDESVTLFIEVIRPDASDRSNALVYQENAEVSPNAVGEDVWRADNIAPARRYRIEIMIQRGERTSHYHYLPDCIGGDAPYDPRVNLVLNDNSGVSFQQTNCSGGGGTAP